MSTGPTAEQTERLPSNLRLERLAYYLLDELQTEIEKGNKWADEVRFRAFKRLEVEHK